MNYRFIKFGFILMLYLSVSDLYPQVTQEWAARYNGPRDTIDVARSVKLDNTGNIYVTGYSFGISTLTDFATIKYSPSGAQLWAVRYNGPGNSFDEANALAVDDSGNVYVTGFSRSSILPGSEDYTTIKYNSNGIQQWVALFDGPANNEDKAYAIVIDNLNGIVVSGYTRNAFFPGSEDITTVRYNSNGVQQWTATFNGPGNNEDKAYAIVIDNTNNIHVAGHTFSSGSNYDYVALKYNSSGIQQWSSIYNGPANDIDKAYAIVIDNTNNIYVMGSSIGTGSNYDYATVKYNSAGSQQWVARFNGPGNQEDKAYAIVIDNTNNIVVTGSSMITSSPGSEDYATVLYNSSGVQQWVQYYNGPGNNEDIGYALAADNSGNFYVTGSSRSGLLAGTEDFATLKYNSAGTQQWSIRYNGPGNFDDKAYAIVIDNTNGIYVAGYSIGVNTYNDYTTIKYTQLIGIEPISGEVPSHFKLYQNYPNPFNPATKIKFDIPPNSELRTVNIELILFDLLGRQVGLLVNRELKPGSYEVELSALSLPAGIYFYKLTADSFSGTKKLVLLK